MEKVRLGIIIIVLIFSSIFTFNRLERYTLTNDFQDLKAGTELNYVKPDEIGYKLRSGSYVIVDEENIGIFYTCSEQSVFINEKYMCPDDYFYIRFAPNRSLPEGTFLYDGAEYKKINELEIKGVLIV